MSTREKIILHYISVFLFSLSDLFLKLIPFFFNNADIFSMMFFQSIFLIIISYLDIKNYKLQIRTDIDNQEKVFIILRGLANFLISTFIFLATYHIKFAIIICIIFSNQIINSFISIFYLNERFHLRYLMGFCLSIIGMLLFAFSGKEDKNLENLNKNANTFLGVFFAFMGCLWCCANTFLNKKLNNFHTCLLNFYTGITQFFITIPFIVFMKGVEKSPSYITINALSALVLHLACTFFNISMIYNSIVFISSLNFSSIVFAFFYGLFIFGESLNAIEFLGVLLILGYNFYTLYCPLNE